jgi:hypothetical protein
MDFVVAAGVYLSEAPPLLGFSLGWSSNFVGSDSGKIEKVKLLAEYSLQRISTAPTHTQPHTVCIYFTLTRGRGQGGELERRLDGQ